MTHRHGFYLGLAVLSVGFGMAAAPVRAQTRININSLYYTGVTNAGASASASSADLHYFLVGNPEGTVTTTSPAALFVTAADGFPIGPWMDYSAANGNSRWIEPTSGTTDTHTAGTYIFRTTFDLTGFQASSAQLSLRVAVDNDMTGVRVNGAAVAGTSTSGFAAFSSAISLSSANATFVSGINTLDFVVYNTPPSGASNPTGLRVEATGTAVTAAVAPEPGTLALLLLGSPALGGIWLCRRTRKAAA